MTGRRVGSIIDSTYVGGCKWGTATADHTVGEVRAFDGPEEDFTNSTCRTSACDICHLLVAGTMGYSCSSCRYKVHKVCPVPLDNVNVQQQSRRRDSNSIWGSGRSSA
uniref:Phorbol-ester/DAG-type domain-containing protein n=1 Tax=Oryza rufipogon TaxID=4529 RepID=A0A0E0PUM4_ORYRU